MNRSAQAVILTAIGGIALRFGITDEHSRFVNEWMRWPLVVSGALIVALAFTAVLKGHAEGHRTTPAAWALVLPIVVAFVIRPVALGGYVAERRVNDVAAVSYDEPAMAGLPPDEVTDMLVSEFVSIAATYGDALEGGEVRLRGFVIHRDGGWYLTRLTIRCCAADAAAFQVRVEGADAPPENQWVEIVGTWIVGTWIEGTGEGVDAKESPALAAAEVTNIEAPKQTYE